MVLADLDHGTLHVAKELTTAERPADGVLDGLSEALTSAAARADEVARAVHATTLATNIVLERRGATGRLRHDRRVRRPARHRP